MLFGFIEARNVFFVDLGAVLSKLDVTFLQLPEACNKFAYCKIAVLDISLYLSQVVANYIWPFLHENMVPQVFHERIIE